MTNKIKYSNRYNIKDIKNKINLNEQEKLNEAKKWLNNNSKYSKILDKFAKTSE